MESTIGFRVARQEKEMSESTLGASSNLLVELTADIVAAYVGNHVVPVSELPSLIADVHAALNNTTQPAAAVEAPVVAEKPKPPVPVKKSIQHDYIICLEDGKKLKMLKRYLRSRYDMSPEDYRRRWGLPPDYPMVAPAYAARRSDFAKQIGLGRGVRRGK